MKKFQCTSITREIRDIKKGYCSKCIHFNGECTKNKIYSKCFRNDEREKYVFQDNIAQLQQ